MASANWTNTPGKAEKDEEKSRLEAELKAMTEEKKTVFETRREADERLRKIREKERERLERLQEIRGEEIERDQRERHAAHIEAELKATKQTAAGLRAELEALKTKNDRLERQLAATSGEDNERKTLAIMRGDELTELERLKRKIFEQNESLENVKANLQQVTSFSSKLQEEEREKEEKNETQLKQIKRLEDKISAARRISAETQLRQLEESPSQNTTELKQTLSELQHQQQRQPAAEEHHQGN